MLDHHTREILKSVLAQFVDLGSSGVGSYALAKDQSQIFLMALDGTAKLIEEVINHEIQRLVDYNWNVEEYPTLTHADLGIKDTEALASAIQTLSTAGMITPDPEMEDYLRKTLKLPEKPEELKDVDNSVDKQENEDIKEEVEDE